MIFRTPITLVVIQSIMVFGAVIPLLLLCKKYGIKPLIALVICFIYIYSPAIVQPLLYDFHENAFIPFFVLWFVYFLESKNFKLSVLFLFLCLMIKEDTSLYMIAICVFYAFRKGYLKIGTIDIKKNEKAIVELSKKYNVKLEIFDKKTLNSQKGEFSHSDFVFRTVGTDCVCERAVVAGGGKLIVKKQSCNGVTIAVGVENEN